MPQRKGGSTRAGLVSNKEKSTPPLGRVVESERRCWGRAASQLAQTGIVYLRYSHREVRDTGVSDAPAWPDSWATGARTRRGAQDTGPGPSGFSEPTDEPVT